MIIPPPRPPKDYVIEDINSSLLSSEQFTPSDRPRVTQPDFAKYAVPVPYREDETPDVSKVHKRKLHPKILNKMMLDEKYSWTIRPGVDDFLYQRMYKKYNISYGTYDPRFMNKEKIFNRSCQYEQSCLEDERLEKLYRKMEVDDYEFEYDYQKLLEKERQKQPPAIYIRPYKQQPPFWWPLPPEEKIPRKAFNRETLVKTPPRLNEEPNLTAIVKDDPCQRKKDMLMVGGSFKHDTCLWYHKRYPPPNIK